MKQRIIKFRIWDNEHMVFRDKNDCSLHCISNWAIDAFTGTVVDYVCPVDDHADDAYSRNPDKGYYVKGLKAIKKPCYILQQFTGLKDGKKKDIYEGDILLLNKDNTYKSYYEVIFEDGTFFLINAKREGDTFGIFTKNLFAALETDSPIVVGNIFENKELLK